MRGKGKKGVKLPEVTQSTLSYALHSINIASNGCYDNARLRLDDGFGDYNMRLFRVKDRKQYLRNIPSAFTPNIQRLLYHPQPTDMDSRDARIATEHNEQIERILHKPKEEYLLLLQREQQRRKVEQERPEFVKGEDIEVRAYGEQLSFNYLPSHEASQWFRVVDRSSTYHPPAPFAPLTSTASFAPSPSKPRKKPRHIFLSDDKSFSIPRHRLH